MGTSHTPRSNRRPQNTRPQRGPRGNRYAGPCSACGHTVPAGQGLLEGGQVTGYTVRHAPQRWIGSPVSGRWAGGCEQAREDAQAAAYATYAGNIAWSALCDEGEGSASQGFAYTGPQGSTASYGPCPGDCDITCNVHGPDVDRGPAYMGPAGGQASYAR